ncbi:MAG TPA: LuxR C-terminal-related transcriptional regulator, partial [Acidimicrobiales bacterium]|nr:LuxR C-terminal-related transcriptional regulator [Acidimicrobiales bacterium]
VAHQVAGARPGGTFFVDLSGLSDPTLVPTAVLRALGLREVPGLDPTESLAARLAKRQLLLLLDNCEHLVGSCAQLTSALLLRCPGVRVLATSREPLGAAGEVVVPLSGLSLPEPARAGDQRWWEESEAAWLFIERARAARAGFSIDGPAAAAAVAQICERLDGIPLALELAAARTRLMSIRAIADGLDDRFHLLVGQGRSGPPRHKTLLASLKWSCGLLSAAELGLLHRLSVFSSGFTLRAAEAICAGGSVDADEVLALLTSLVDKSLVQALPDVDRFRQHETMRAYGTAALEAEGVTGAVRDRHLRYFTDLARAMEPRTWTSEVTVALAALGPELDNFRAALDWSVESGQFGAGAALLGALENFFYQIGLYSETAARCEPFLVADLDAPRRADILDCASRFMFHKDHVLSLRLGSELVAFGRSIGDEAVLARGLHRVAAIQGEAEPRQALEAADEAARLALKTGQLRLAAETMSPKGWALNWLGRPAEALIVGEEGLAAALEVDSPIGACLARQVTSTAARLTGGLAIALEMAEDIVRLDAELGPSMVAAGHAARAEALLCLGRPGAVDAVAGARCIVEESLDMFQMANYQSCQGRIWLSLGREEGYEILQSGNARQESFGSLAMCVNNRAVLAEAAIRRGDLPAARQHLDASSWRLPKEVEPAGVPTLRAEARLARAQGQSQKAHALACAGLEAALRGGAVLWVIDLLELTAITAVDIGRHAEAARLVGAAHHGRKTTGYVRSVPANGELAQVLVGLRSAMGEETYEEARVDGGALTLEDAVAYARRGRGANIQAVSGWDSLTPTERQVTGLVAQHLTNAEIAQQLFVSTPTVKSHLTRVFAKLGIRGRRELAKAAQKRDGNLSAPCHFDS